MQVRNLKFLKEQRMFKLLEIILSCYNCIELESVL